MKEESTDLPKLTHLDARGRASMVDITHKKPSERCALAMASITMSEATVRALVDESVPKGDVFATARIAGIQAAKKTSEIIPLCHQICLTHCEIDFELDTENQRVFIQSQCKVGAGTGVEMEALTAVTVAALTIYDMCKAIDPAMVIQQAKLISKTGGKSDFLNGEV